MVRTIDIAADPARGRAIPRNGSGKVLKHRLRDEVDRVRAAANQAVADTHKQYRRDLVPLRQEVVLYQQGQRRRRR